MILRWHYYRNLVTARDVATYSAETGESLSASRKALARETPRVLQFSVDQGQTWHDVPTVCEPHPDAR